VRGNFFALFVDRSVKEELGKTAGGEPWHPAVVAHAAKRQAAVAFDAVPAETRGLETFAGHGLHGIAEEGFDVADLHGSN